MHEFLLIDDDPLFLELLALNLTELGARVHCAQNAEEALRSLERRRPDMVLCDVDMPDVRGPELRRMARDLGWPVSTPFVFLTALDSDSPELEHLRPVLQKAKRADALAREAFGMIASKEVAGEVARSSLFDGALSRLHRVAWGAHRWLSARTRRALDVAVSGAALVLLAPLLATLALLIRRQDGGPAIYAQERIGRAGRPFRFYKFRSMGIDADARRAEVVATADAESPRFKDKCDPRITPVGHWLRRFSLDELPQLWNVLRGDMALVGPRPPLREETDAYATAEWRRLDVTPGLTCTWQVSGRSELSFERQVALDVEYIERRSLFFDLALLFRTVPAVLTGRGAY